MERYFISAIVLYALVVVVYLLRERMLKRKKNAAKKAVFNLFRPAVREDIIGKSRFNILEHRQSRTQATTLKENGKGIDNAPIFADGNEKKTPVAIPSDELDAVFSTDNKSENIKDENSNEINLVIENTAPEFEPEYNEDIDEEETEEADTEGGAGVSIALGLVFDDLAGMVQTVDTIETATSDEREEAGRVLVEMRQTDMFEQIVSGEPKKEAVVSTLMDDYFAAFHRKKQAAGEVEEPTVKAPEGFDVRSFA